MRLGQQLLHECLRAYIQMITSRTFSFLLLDGLFPKRINSRRWYTPTKFNCLLKWKSVFEAVGGNACRGGQM